MAGSRRDRRPATGNRAAAGGVTVGDTGPAGPEPDESPAQPLFIVDDLVRAHAGDEVAVLGEEAHHAAAVRRIRAGELVDLTDGGGTLATAEVIGVDRQQVTCRLTGVTRTAAATPRIVVVQALVKRDAEAAIAQLVEVGVDRIIPWAAQRCIVRWDAARTERGLRRWRQAAREAGKQSRRPLFAEVTEPVTTGDLCVLLDGSVVGAATAVTATVRRRVVVLHESARLPLAATLTGDGSPVDEVVLVVGPEGGITDDELGRFAAVGAGVARMGPTVMRATTAGTAAASVAAAQLGRW